MHQVGCFSVHFDRQQARAQTSAQNLTCHRALKIEKSWAFRAVQVARGPQTSSRNEREMAGKEGEVLSTSGWIQS